MELPHLVFTAALTLLYLALFVLSIILSVRRRERGFKVLPLATGLWFLNSVIPWIPSPALLRMTMILFPVALLTAVIALWLLVLEARMENEP